MDGDDEVVDCYTRPQELMELKRFREAGRELDRLLAQDPRDAVALCLRSTVLLKSGDPEGAREAARAAVREAPELSLPQAALAEALMASDDYEGARLAASRAVELDPDEFRAWHALTNAQAFTDRTAEAVESGRMTVALEPELVSSWFVLANAALAHGDLATAEDGYRHALRLNPHHAQTLTSLGALELLSRRRLRGIAHTLTALSLEPGLLRTLFNVDLAMMQLLARLNWILLAGAVVTVCLTLASSVAGSVAALVITVLGVALVATVSIRLVRVAPRSLGRYLRSLARREPLIGLRATVVAVALVVLGLSVVAGGGSALWWRGVSLLGLVAAMVLGVLLIVRMNGRDRGPTFG